MWRQNKMSLTRLNNIKLRLLPSCLCLTQRVGEKTGRPATAPFLQTPRFLFELDSGHHTTSWGFKPTESYPETLVRRPLVSCCVAILQIMSRSWPSSPPFRQHFISRSSWGHLEIILRSQSRSTQDQLKINSRSWEDNLRIKPSSVEGDHKMNPGWNKEKMTS